MRRLSLMNRLFALLSAALRSRSLQARRLRFQQQVARLFFLLFALIHGAAAAQTPHTIVGDVRVHKGFHSKILNNVRDVLVYLPLRYDSDKKRRYPVLYLHDGQNLFDGATAFIPGQEWRVDETAQSLITSRKIEPR